MNKFIFIILAFTGCIFRSLSCQSAPVSHIGYGIGMPYGSIGVKLDYQPMPYVAASLGLGPVPSVGINLYLRNRDTLWRPRIGYHYGRIDYWSMEKNGKHMGDSFKRRKKS